MLLLLSAKGISLPVSVKLAGHGAEVFTAVAAVIICLCFWSLWAPLWDLTVRSLLMLILGLFTLEWGGCRLAALLSPILLRCSSCSLRTIAILGCGLLGWSLILWRVVGWRTCSLAAALFFVRFSHFLLFGIVFKVADEGPRGRRDGIVNSSQFFSKHVLKVLVGVGILCDGYNSSPVQEEGRLEKRSHNFGLVLVETIDYEEN